VHGGAELLQVVFASVGKRRRPAVRPHQVGALDGDRLCGAAESQPAHRQPERAVAAVLRFGDENLGDAMQLSARPDVRVGIVEPNTALPNGRQRAPTG